MRRRRGGLDSRVEYPRNSPSCVNMASGPTLPPIIIVDDSQDDLDLIRRLFSKAGVKNAIVAFDDPRVAISYLQNPPANGQPRPCLIFTDLKMPGMDGFEFVAWIRRQPSLAGIPVVMLSGSGEAKDVARAKAAGVHTYLVKLPEPAALAEIVADSCASGGASAAG